MTPAETMAAGVAADRRSIPRPERTLADMLEDANLGAMRHCATKSDPERAAITRAYGIAKDDTTTPAAFRAAMHRAHRTAPRGPLEAICANHAVADVSARILRSVGIDPVDMLLASLWSDTNVVARVADDVAIDLYASRGRGIAMVSLRLGSAQTAIWNESGGGDASGIEIERPLPETLRAASVGRPLCEIVSHRILDPLGLVVTDAEITPRGSTILTLAPPEAP